MTLNALNQPRTGYTYVTDVKPANRASLFALRDLLLEMKQSEAAHAVENAINAVSEATAQLHAVEQASALEAVDEQAEILDAVQMFGGEHTILEPFSHEDWMDEKRTQEEARY